MSGPRTRRTACAADAGQRRSGRDAPHAGDDRDEPEEEGELSLLQGEGRLDRRDPGDERGEAQPLGGVGDRAGPPGSGIGVGHVRTIAAREPASGGKRERDPARGRSPVSPHGGGSAEDRGFEPLRDCSQHAFQACALGHYANPPRRRLYGGYASATSRPLPAGRGHPVQLRRPLVRRHRVNLPRAGRQQG